MFTMLLLQNAAHFKFILNGGEKRNVMSNGRDKKSILQRKLNELINEALHLKS